MALPKTIRVKLSSEEATAVSFTPVVAQELPIRELLEHVLGVTGKDEARVREILLRGTLVIGASRFRWPGWEPDAAGVQELLATFPDSDPSRPFNAEHCVRAVLRGGIHAVEIPREAGGHKRLFQTSSFWELVMQMISAAEMRYGGYSYRERADRYLREFSPTEVDQIRAASERLKYSSLRERILRHEFHQAELFVVRSGA